MSYKDNIKLFALNSNKPLAEKIAKRMGLKLSTSSVVRFSDGEIQVDIDDSVRGKDVFLIQSTSAPVNGNLMELLIMIDAVRRASAASVTTSSARRLSRPVAPAISSRDSSARRSPARWS